LGIELGDYILIRPDDDGGRSPVETLLSRR